MSSTKGGQWQILFKVAHLSVRISSILWTLYHFSMNENSFNLPPKFCLKVAINSSGGKKSKLAISMDLPQFRSSLAKTSASIRFAAKYFASSSSNSMLDECHEFESIGCIFIYSMAVLRPRSLLHSTIAPADLKSPGTSASSISEFGEKVISVAFRFLHHQ